MEDIEYFLNPQKDRSQNDSHNKKREDILEIIFTEKATEYLVDDRWKSLKEKLLNTFQKICECDSIKLVKKAGRKFNYDFLATFYKDEKVVKEVKLEFKFGEKEINKIPEYYNASANKKFHDLVYAKFFYDNYLELICYLYDLEMPSEDIYMKEIYKNSSKVDFFKKLKEKENEEPEKKELKSLVVNQSISEYLEKIKDHTNLEIITSELKRTQTDKIFLLYSDGEFYLDQIQEEELEAACVKGIVNENVLEIQSKCLTTTHRMLLRWKNHKGILFPAWQISLSRKLAK